MKEPLPAQPLPGSTPPAPGRLCQGITQRGKPCPWHVEGSSSYCVLHDPARKEERRRVLQEKGKQGRKKQIENQAAQVAAVSLATGDAIRSVLERALARVEGSKADELAKGNVIARLSAVALGVRKTCDLERLLEEIQERLALMDKNR